MSAQICPKIYITPASTDEKTLYYEYISHREEETFMEQQISQGEEQRRSIRKEGCMQVLLVDASLSLCTHILYASVESRMRLIALETCLQVQQNAGAVVGCASDVDGGISFGLHLAVSLATFLKALLGAYILRHCFTAVGPLDYLVVSASAHILVLYFLLLGPVLDTVTEDIFTAAATHPMAFLCLLSLPIACCYELASRLDRKRNSPAIQLV